MHFGAKSSVGRMRLGSAETPQLVHDTADTCSEQFKGFKFPLLEALRIE